MDGRDRADARGRVVERRPVPAGRTTEEEQIGHRLQVVLDPVTRFLRQRPLELGARGGPLVRRCFTANRSREQERHADDSRDESKAHHRRAGGQRSQRSCNRARPRADAEPEAAAPPGLHDRDEGDRQEQQQGEVRAAVDDEQRDECDQPATPQIEQEPAASSREPRLPGNDHRDGVGGCGGERQADQEPTMPRAHVEREPDQYCDDRGPPEQDADLNGDRAEAELDGRVAIACGCRAKTRLSHTACKRPTCGRVVSQEAGQEDPVRRSTTVEAGVVLPTLLPLPTYAGS